MCTALLNKALNQDQVIAVHIDNGFMRKRESQSVEEALTKLGIKLKGGCGLTDGICLLFRLVCQILCGLCIMESYFGGFSTFHSAEMFSGERLTHILQWDDDTSHLGGGQDSSETDQ